MDRRRSEAGQSVNRPKVRTEPRIAYSDRGGEPAKIAADELAQGLGAMLSGAIDASMHPSIDPLEMRIGFEDGVPANASRPGSTPSGDGFSVSRGGGSISIRAGSARGLIHAAAATLEKLGARFAPGAPPLYPHIEPERLAALEPFAVRPAFARRAMISDLMTWNYNFADRLELHLHHDREFIPWMARRGLNAFEFIRHAHDTRLKIDEIAPLMGERGIAAEYGGHILQLLMPRERFEANPEYFPAGDDGKRAQRGNLCVSNRDAMELVREGALRYVREHPENELLHVWGADVWSGAWCRCGNCRELEPQLQYMEVVNAIAAELANDPKAPPVAYLAYHDTLEPHRGLKPLANVRVEWAPRERCYVHAIDDAKCAVNRRHLETLKRHLEIFGGRCDIFEYYADAILFGGLGFATPTVIARDLLAYRALGIESVSCLTFGAFGALAYPVNLETFARAACDPDFDGETANDDAAAGRHPACASEMAAAYRTIERASRLVLDYADVMRPVIPPERAPRKAKELREAVTLFNEAIAAADAVKSSLAGAEREMWRYSAGVLAAIADYIGARADTGADRRERGAAAIEKIASAISAIRAIEPEFKGAWGAYDLEWIRELWLEAMRRGLDSSAESAQEMF
ncbi:MAG: DUF4838 domain-containing protein [Candidatus Binataceae bacterium]